MYSLVMAFENQINEISNVDVVFEEPPLFKVILLNDDFTTKEFVVEVLMKVFHKSKSEAIMVMESVHKNGRGIAGIYVYDIAATRAQMTMKRARDAGFPLKCILERKD